MATVEIIGRLLLALAVVLGVIWVIARKLRSGAARGRLRGDKLIDVLGRQSLSRGSSVAVVRVADTALIVGVTDSNVRVLQELELDTVRSWIAANDPGARRLGPATTAVNTTAASSASHLSTAAPSNAELDVIADELARRRAADVHAAATAASSGATLAPPLATASGMGALTPTDLPSRVAGERGTPARGPLSGSALSPATWRQTLDALRDMTARKG